MARLLYRRISTRVLVQGAIYIWRQEVWCRPSLGHLTLNKSQFALNPARLELNHHDHAITHMHWGPFTFDTKTFDTGPAPLEANYHDLAISHIHCTIMAHLHRYISMCGLVSHLMTRGLMLARPQTFDAKQISTCIEPAHLEVNHHDHAITHMHCTIMACLLLISIRRLVQGSIYIWHQEVWHRPGHGGLEVNLTSFSYS